MRCLIGEVSLARSASESYVKTLLPRCAEVAKSRSSSKAAAIKVLRLSDSDQDTGTKTQASLFGSSSVPLSHFRGGTEQSLGDPMFLRPPSHESMPLLAFRPRRGTGPETKPKAFLGLELQRAIAPHRFSADLQAWGHERIASIEKAAALRKERDAHFLGAYPDARPRPRPPPRPRSAPMKMYPITQVIGSIPKHYLPRPSREKPRHMQR